MMADHPDWTDYLIESLYHPVGYNPETGKVEEVVTPPIKDGDPFAEKLLSTRNWRRVVYAVDTQTENFDNPLHEIRFYLDLEAKDE